MNADAESLSRYLLPPLGCLSFSARCLNLAMPTPSTRPRSRPVCSKAHIPPFPCADRWFASQAYRTRTCPLCKTDPVAPTTPTATAAESTAADQASSEREAVPPEAPDETPRTLDLPVDAATQSAVGRR